MKAPAFEYLRPRDVVGALDALQSGAGAAKILAGGQSLLPMLNLRLARPALLIDIGRIDALRSIEDKGSSIRIGAAVTHTELEDRAIDGCAFLRQVAGGIAYRAVRNRGTIGGSLVHADPAADWPLALAALGATIEIAGRKGRRIVPADVFVAAAFQTAIADDELVVAVDVPKLSAGSRTGYYKFCRKTGEFPEASAAAVFDPDRRIARIFIGALSGAPRPLDQLATAAAQQGASAVTESSIAASVDPIAGDDPVDRRMRRGAVARALKQVFA